MALAVECYAKESPFLERREVVCVGVNVPAAAESQDEPDRLRPPVVHHTVVFACVLLAVCV